MGRGESDLGRRLHSICRHALAALAWLALAAPVWLALAAPGGPARADAPGDEAPAARPLEAALPLEIAGASVAPGTTRRLGLVASESFAGSPVSIPVHVTHGLHAGPVLCLAGGIHGDEINGVEVVRRSVETFDGKGLRGSLVALPIVNLHGFRRGSRYLPDRRDLNRYFPGRMRGSAASRVAHAVFDGVIQHCDFLLDFHTGSFQRANLPHVRGHLADPGVRDLAAGLVGWLVLDHPGTLGTLRRAATDLGIPTITFEVGGPYRIEPSAVEAGLAGISAVMAHLGLQGAPTPGRPAVARHSHWVRVDDGGLLFTEVEIGDAVARGERLGVVIDPLSSHRSEVQAPVQGRIIGMAWSQVVIPGFAAFHLAVAGAATEEDEILPGEPTPPPLDPTEEPDEPETVADDVESEDRPE